ncbi:FimV/HubP family polar landmark protein [Comamonas kerstersii]|uniref:FimV/HubP family polar landmark protein n=2 Tax=Comamonas kerstersii TaxID=225992 RepID=UPI003A8F8E3D
MHRWKLSALAAAAFATTAFTSLSASALTLGALRVDSALGESLRAEIAIPQATPAELSNLIVQIAPPEAFRARGLDYSAAASSINVQLVQKPDGTALLQLRSNAPLNDPFVDLIVDTQWNTGSMQRSYTLLLDPPSTPRSAAPATAAAPQITAPQVTAPAPVSVTGKTYSSSPRIRATTPPAQPVAAAAAPAPAPASAPNEAVRVRSGDTAGRIANANRPAGVSLDQMLVAMLRSNPNAFINGNVNRLRAGTVLQMPSREQALETSAQEARQIVAAQSRDFNAYRRSLAAKAPQAAVQAAARSASGQVQAQVSETRANAETADKLTLSKGAIQTAAEEEKLAAHKQAEAQESRLSELQRNLAELNELAQSSTPASANASTQPAETPAAPAAATAAPADSQAAASAEANASLPAVEVASANAALIESNASAAADATPAASSNEAPPAAPAEEPAPKPAAAQPRPVPAPAPMPVEEPSLLDNPLVPAGGALIAILLGLLGYSTWKRRRAAQAAEQDPSLGDSQLHPDTFFAGSGGQHVDTTDAAATTMAYALSQLDGGADVDPVAEADVYLAYGRDVQAEEILKEALRTQPERTAIYVKLAEIYAKREDAKALEEIARSLQPHTEPGSSEWQRVTALGRQLAPQNPLYADAADAASNAPADKPGSGFAAALQASTAAAATGAAAGALASDTDTASSPELPILDLSAAFAEPSETAPATPATDTTSSASETKGDTSALDSQLDLSSPFTPSEPPSLVQDTVQDNDSISDALDLDLSGFEANLPQSQSTPATEPAAAADQLDDGLNFDLSIEAPAAEAAPAETPEAPSAPAPDTSLDFDLGSLNLDLGTDTSAKPADNAKPMHNLADDPLSTKLDLAREFNAIGDSEGARALIEEVLAEASGSLKERAQKMLSELD